MAPSKTGVILTTYNQAEWLSKVLIGYEMQSEKNFTLIIADDGSGPETEAVIDQCRQRGLLRIQHIWHPDQGFRKCQILNKAIEQTDCDYLIFSDGDCIPEPDFVRKHIRYARRGQFLSGGYVKLTMPVSKTINETIITESQLFDLEWLKKQGQPDSAKLWKLFKSEWIKLLLNFLTPTKATWNGMNSSAWREDIIACNGFNEDMQYGGLDRELGERLLNYGLKGKQIRYSIACLHLDHPRAYDNPETWKKNYAIRNKVKRTGRFVTYNGIRKIDPEPQNVSGYQPTY